MDLRIVTRPVTRQAERDWRPRWLLEFECWAAPAEALPGEEPERPSFLPVGLLLGLALLGQYAQLAHPAIHAYIVERNVDFRAAWMGFTILKQAALFTLMLLALRLREQRLASLGFPTLDFRRLLLVFVLLGFFLGVAVLRRPPYDEAAAAFFWLDAYYPGERVLQVVLNLVAAVVEETFFRGFAILWTLRWSGHLPLALLLPAAVFAAGHAYISLFNVPAAFVLALVFSGLFLWRRDLYWPMVLHFVINSVFLLG